MASGTSHAIKDVSFTLAMPLSTATNVRVPLVFNGELTYNNQPLRLNGRLENFDAFMRAQPIQARIAVGSNSSMRNSAARSAATEASPAR